MIFDDLPKVISVFPLSNAIFFPKTILPLNIFEKRYIQLVSDCMKNQRLFGMIQPTSKKKLVPEVYKVGCLGKIINFNEISDGRYIINLSGIIRFKIQKELSTDKLYRKFEVDYSEFKNDLHLEKIEKEKYNVKNLLQKINSYFKKKQYSIQLSELEELNFDQLISTICMIAPFSVEEKQKLIETIKIEQKIQILEEIININLFDNMESRTIQ
tara:strand:- start:203 stop:841 length:639 start_codon:yes stop_codon:yes gene_type:complete